LRICRTRKRGWFCGAICLLVAQGVSAYTTPNTGVNWTMEDLVVHAGGKITGSYPNYTLHQSIWLNTNDTLSIAAGSVITSVDGSPWPTFGIRGTLVAAGTEAEPITFTSGPLRGGSDTFDRCLEFQRHGVTNSMIQHVIVEHSRIGIILFDVPSLVLSNVIARYNDWGIYSVRSSPHIVDSLIHDNGPGGGGAGIRVDYGSPIIEHCTIRSNETMFAESFNAGGGVLMQWVNDAYVTDSEIHGNTAQFGGGIAIMHSTNIVIDRSKIHSNDLIDLDAPNGVRDVQLEVSESAYVLRNPRLGECFYYHTSGEFVNNVFDSYYGAITVENCSPLIAHNYFRWGYIDMVAVWENSSPLIANNVFKERGVWVVSPTAQPVLQNNIFDGYYAGYGYYRRQYNDTTLTSIGEVNALPGSSGNVDAHIPWNYFPWNYANDGFVPPNSPTIDAGIPLTFRDSHLDLEGRERPMDGNLDGNAIPDVGPLELHRHAVTFLPGTHGEITGGDPFQMIHTGGSAIAPEITPYEGMAFIGWDKSFNYVTEPITVTAQYEVLEYTLSYSTTGFGTIEGATNQTVQYGNDGSPVTAVPNEGHQFWRWSDGVTHATRQETNVMESISVQAQYTVLVTNLVATQRPGMKLVDIEYDLSGAHPVKVELLIQADDEPIPAASLSGAIGTGVSPGTGKTIQWDIGADWNHQAAPDVEFSVSVFMLPSDDEPVSVLATSGDLDSRDYTLEVIASRGEATPPPGLHTYARHAAVTASSTSHEPGYSCVGWTGTGSIPSTGATTNTGEIILTNLASSIEWLWQPNNYTVTLDPMGGFVNPSDKIVVFNQPYGTLPLPIRSGYEFQGWWTEPLGGILVTPDDIVSSTNHHILYAHWPHHDYVANLNGDGQHIRLPHQAALDLGNTLTIESWIKPTDLSGRHTVFSTGSNSPGSFALEIGPGSGGTNRVALTGAGDWVLETGDHAIHTGQWNHLAYVRSGPGENSHTLYINGRTQPLTTSGPYDFIDSDADRLIGSGPDGDRSFVGELVEFRIWNTARTEDDLRDNMHLRVAGDTPGLIALYALDHNIMDASPNSLHGEWEGTPSFLEERAPLANVITGQHHIRGAWAANPDSLRSSLISLEQTGMVNAKEFLLFGHNQGDIVANTNDVPDRFLWRLDRVWRMEATGVAGGTAVVEYTGLEELIQETERLRLLVSETPSFAHAIPYHGVYSNGQLRIPWQEMAHDLYVTLGEWDGDAKRRAVKWMPPPKAYWPFNGDDLDHSGNENHGQWTDASFVDGQFGLARQFGTGEYFAALDSEAFNNFEQLSMSIWFKGGAANGGPLIGRWDWPDSSFAIWIDNWSRVAAGVFDATMSVQTPWFIVDEQDLWHCYGLTYDGDEIMLYINGFPVAANVGGQVQLTTIEPKPFGINLDHRLQQSPISGTVERAYVFSEALTPEQMATLYTGMHPSQNGSTYKISPLTVSAVGGDLVTISGVDLGLGGNDITNVTLCGIEAEVISQSSGQVVVRAGMSMTALTGTVTVVSHAYGPITFPDEFTYEAPPSWTIEIVSAHGQTDPPPGFHERVNGSIMEIVVTNSVVQLVDTQLHASAWSGTGSATSGTGTSVTFQVLSDSHVEWLWTTSVWWQAEAGDHGTIEAPEPGWYALGTPVEVEAIPSNWYAFEAWTGDVEHEDTAKNPLHLDLDQARRIVAQFQEIRTTQGTPLWWLDQMGADPTEEGAEALAAGNYRYWEHHIAGTDPNDSEHFFAMVHQPQTASGDSITIRWRSVEGRLYDVDRFHDLTTDPERIATGIPGQADYTTFTDQDTVVPGLYIYRISVRMVE
jgi:hypothetical protein